MNNKQIIKIVKAVVPKSTVLPMLEDVKLTGTHLTVTDLETEVTVPYQTGIDACVPSTTFLAAIEMMKEPRFKAEYHNEIPAVTVEEGKRKVKMMGDKMDDYPKSYLRGEGRKREVIGTWTDRELQMVNDALPFSSSDDLRPAMTGVFAGKHISATDGHRLYWRPITPLWKNVIIPKKTARILQLFAGEGRVWTLYKIADPEQADCVDYSFQSDDGVLVSFRAIDANFPQYEVVIPQGDAPVNFHVEPKVMMEELKNAIKFSNRSTNQVVLTLNGKATVHSQDVDFSYEYEGEVPADYTFPDNGDAFQIAFNGKMLLEMLLKVDKAGPVHMKMWAPHKAAIINEHLLLMPLLLNK